MTTKIGFLAQELARTNTWWRDSSWWRTDPDLSDARELDLPYRATCLDDLDLGGLYILRGPRRSGKTVAVKQTIANLIDEGTDPRAIVAVAVDGWNALDLRTLTQNATLPMIPANSRRWWFIDEITAVKGDWVSQIKWLRDNEPTFRNATVVLTGSNATGLSVAVGALAGRRGHVPKPDRTLLPMGFRTFAEILHPDLANTGTDRASLDSLHSRKMANIYNSLVPWLDTLVNCWERYLSYGGFPVAVANARHGTVIPPAFLDAIFDVIYRDTFAGARLSETTTTAFLHRIGNGLCSPFNYSAAGRDVEMSADATIRRVVELRDSYLIWQCPQRAEKSWVPRARAQDKLYFVDPLVANLTHLRSPHWPAVDPTALVEQQIGMALRRHIEADTPGGWSEHDHLFHVRTAARKEIDFVGPNLGNIAVEAKYVDHGGWTSAAAAINTSESVGILTTRNVLDTSPESDRAWAVPAALFAYLVDT